MASSSAARLLAWYRRHRRELPWRGPFPREAYLVLVSEVMAQQTQVARAAAAFPAFTTRFPSLTALAAATDDEVVHAFAGLGYYHRARLLRRTAAAIVARGAWPTSPAELASLPGIGRYTAAAVAAFAFASDEAPVDGNVARVAARHEFLELALGDAALVRAARNFATGLRSRRSGPEVWEALMELGAIVCTPTAPACPDCPLLGTCKAAASGSAAALPRPRRRRSRVPQRWVVLWLVGPGHTVLLRRVESSPLLRGLWLPPFTELAGESDAETAARALASAAGWRVPLAPAAAVRHAITHRDITVLPFVGLADHSRAAEGCADWSWQNPGSPSVPTSTLLGKLAAVCRTVAAASVPTER